MLPAETYGGISPLWAIRSICYSTCGLINSQGRDAFCRRVIFPCRQHGQIVNLYGRSIGAAFPHRLLPRSKGGLFAWESVSSFSTVILVEGLFDLAVLWQAGFRNTTCAIGTHLTPAQLSQLSDQPGRSVYIAFDQDENQAGQKPLTNSPSACKTPASRRTSSSCHTGMILTATSSPAPPPPISLPAWRSTMAMSLQLTTPQPRPPAAVPIACSMRTEKKSAPGQRFSGCPAASSTLAALAARLCL